VAKDNVRYASLLDGYDENGDLWNNPNGVFDLPDGIYHGDTENSICCPIFQHGYNTYDWTNINYFQATE